LVEISKQILLHDISIEAAFENTQNKIMKLETISPRGVDAYGSAPSHLITVSHFPHEFTLNYRQQDAFFKDLNIDLLVNFFFKFTKVGNDVLITIYIPYSNKRSYYAELDVLLNLLKEIKYIKNDKDLLNNEEILYYTYFFKHYIAEMEIYIWLLAFLMISLFIVIVLIFLI
jgi:hypothetical protein